MDNRLVKLARSSDLRSVRRLRSERHDPCSCLHRQPCLRTAGLPSLATHHFNHVYQWLYIQYANTLDSYLQFLRFILQHHCTDHRYHTHSGKDKPPCTGLSPFQSLFRSMGKLLRRHRLPCWYQRRNELCCGHLDNVRFAQPFL